MIPKPPLPSPSWHIPWQRLPGETGLERLAYKTGTFASSTKSHWPFFSSEQDQMALTQFSSFSGHFIVTEHVPLFPLGVENTILLKDSRCCHNHTILRYTVMKFSAFRFGWNALRNPHGGWGFFSYFYRTGYRGFQRGVICYTCPEILNIFLFSLPFIKHLRFMVFLWQMERVLLCQVCPVLKCNTELFGVKQREWGHFASWQNNLVFGNLICCLLCCWVAVILNKIFLLCPP